MSRHVQSFDPLFDSDLIRRALAEDVGRGDVTTQATIAPGTQSSARIVAREAGVIAGLPIAALTFAQLDPDVQFETLMPDGTAVEAGTTLARISGDAAALLTAERTALNFLGRLSGIATPGGALCRGGGGHAGQDCGYAQDDAGAAPAGEVRGAHGRRAESPRRAG